MLPRSTLKDLLTRQVSPFPAINGSAIGHSKKGNPADRPTGVDEDDPIVDDLTSVEEEDPTTVDGLTGVEEEDPTVKGLAGVDAADPVVGCCGRDREGGGGRVACGVSHLHSQRLTWSIMIGPNANRQVPNNLNR